MIRTIFAPVAALALLAGTALASPASPQSGITSNSAPKALDWVVTKQIVGYKRCKFRGHRFSHRRFRGCGIRGPGTVR